jgi:hypothetical protein
MTFKGHLPLCHLPNPNMVEILRACGSPHGIMTNASLQRPI